MHKDYAKGINKARREAFPRARPCDDYPHMRRAVEAALASKLTQVVLVEGRARRQQTFRKKYLDLLLRLLRDTRFLPTLQLYDACWRVIFAMMSHWGEAVASAYLRNTYFLEISLESAQKHGVSGEHVGAPATSCSQDTGRGFWAPTPARPRGIRPWSPSIRSRWQHELNSRGRANPRRIFAEMHKLFTDSWQKTFSWGTARSFCLYPRYLSEDLFNGAALRTAGRSPAVDFWVHRDPPPTTDTCSKASLNSGSCAARETAAQKLQNPASR